MQTVSRNYRNFIKCSEHIQFGQCDILRLLAPDAVTACNSVKRSDTARSACCCAELSAALPQFFIPGFAHRRLRYKRSLAYACGICFHDAYHVVERASRNTGTDRGIACDCIGAGCKRINAIINIAERSKLRLKQNIFPLTGSSTEQCSHVADIIFEKFCLASAPLHNLIIGERLLIVYILQHQILAVDDNF